MPSDRSRGVSPVVATILLVALVILLASILTAGLTFVDAGFRMPSFASDGESDAGGSLIYALDDDPEKSSVRHRAEFPIPAGSSLDGDSLNSVEIE
ncbi:MAG: archaellin/type IV pilin N-terminal domain-containing protein [Haloferacaceae archaeon]